MTRLVAVMLLLMLAAPANAACRQALALGLDVSGSVDPSEYRLQLDGLAAALEDAEVQTAFLTMPFAPVRIMVYEWSGPHYQRELIGWITPQTQSALSRIAGQLRATGPIHINYPSTAISPALRYGAAALADQSDCWQLTLDISGDGPANIGQAPGELTEAVLGQVTVNGLVIGANARANTTKNLLNVKSLETYYREDVIRGPNAFVEIATSFEDFADAMKRKLLREVSAPVLSLRSDQ